MKHFMVGQKASDEAKIESDFYAIVLRYELHESMENLIEVLYPRIYEERNRIKTTPLYRFEKEYVQGFCCIICYHFPCERSFWCHKARSGFSSLFCAK